MVIRDAARILGRTPRGVLGAVALAAAVEMALARHGDAVCDWMAFSWRDSARAAAGPGAWAEVLCFGDSLVKEGVLPGVIGRRLGRPAYNLAVHGGPAPASDFLLRRATDAGARPRVVVVDFHPNLLSSAPRSSGLYWPELLGVGGVWELGWVAHDPGLALRTVGLGMSPSLRHRDAIREAIAAAVRGEEGDGRRLCRALARNFRVNLGAWVAPVTPPPADPEGLLLGLPDRGAWKPHRANLAFMHRLFDRAGRLGIPVVWLVPPTSPTWLARRRVIGAEATYDRLARSMLAEHANLVVVDGRPAGYGASAFHDLTHLHADAASAFSADLADAIAPVVAARRVVGPRWIELPKYEGGGARGSAVEDLDQSRLAVGQGAAVRLR